MPGPDERLWRRGQAWLVSAGKFITRPPASLVDRETRRRSRLLLGVIATLIVTGGLVLALQAVLNPDSTHDFDFWLTAAIWLVGCGLYMAARRGHTTIPAASLIALLFVLSSVAPFAPDSLSSLPFYVVIPLLLTSLFFSFRWVLRLAALALVVPAVLALAAFPDDARYRQLMTEAFLYVLPVGGLILIAVNHQSAVERIRQEELQAAYDRVRASEMELERQFEARAQELNRLEQSLREAQRRYYALFEQAHDAVFLLDLQGGYLEANRRAADLFGYTVAEMQQLTFRDLSLDIPASEKTLERLLAGELVVPYERVFRRKDGSHVLVEINAELVRDLNGRPLHIQSVVRDITERKQMENELRASYAELDRFFTVALDLLCIADAEGRFVKLNPAWETVLGYPLAELEGRRFLDFVHPDDHQATLKVLGQLNAGEPVLNFTNRYLTRAGGWRFIEWKAQPHGKWVYAAARDVTERRQAEQALKEIEARQRALLDAIPDLLFRIRRDGLFLDYHAGDPTRLAVPPEQFMGRTVDDVLPSDVSALLMRQVEEVLQSGTESICEYSLLIRDHLLDFEAYTVPSGPDEVLMLVREVTERNKMKEQAFSLAVERERIKVLSQFVRNASHELRTPLAVLNSSLYLAAKTNDAEKRQVYLERGKQQVSRLARLVDSVLAMTRLDSGVPFEFHQTDVNALVQRVVSAAQPALAEKALHARFTPDRALPRLPIDSDWLQEALQHVLDNAIRFTPSGGSVALRTYQQAGCVAIDVSDTGGGISPEALPHVFARFWRQDEAHTTPGFGLGLAIAQKIVERHGGCAEVESEVGRGTTVRLVLPAPDTPT